MDQRTVRALLGALGLYAIATTASYLFLRWYLPPPGDVSMMAGLLGAPLAGSLGYLFGSRRYFRESRLILRSAERPELKDGQRCLAIGRVEALGPGLKAPFTGKSCVAYQYTIDHLGRTANHRRTWIRDYWGMAVHPYQVRTAAGPVRILGYARLEGPPLVPDDDEAYRAAAAYLESTSFRHPASLGERHGSLAEPLSTESDSFGDDICADDSHLHQKRGCEAELRRLRLQERRLEAGETVCAAGQYSETRKALVPTSSGMEQLRLSTYSPENWAAENRRWGRTYIGWGLGFGVFSIACALASRWC